MHIAYLHYLLESDPGCHHVRQFAEAARLLGHRMDVHAMNLAPDAQGPGLENPSFKAVLKRQLRYWLHEPKEILWNARYIRRDTKKLVGDPPDVLLVRDHLLTASCVSVARRLRRPLVLEMNSPAEENRMYLKEYMHIPLAARILERYKVRRADALTAVSSTLKRILVATYGIAEHRVFVVPNGADLMRFQPDTTPDPHVVWPPGSGPVIGFVGSFRAWHGIQLLARMILEVAAARPATCFLLVGDGPGAAMLRTAVGSLGRRVLMTGRVPHERVPALTAAFDIGVLPETLFYGSPLKMIEWMAAGRSIVAPAYTALEDVVEDGRHAILFRPREGADFVSAVLRLVDDAGLRSRLGIAAAERARSSLSWRDNARRVIAACEAALRWRDGQIFSPSAPRPQAGVNQ